jgi:hypothetical protein
LVTKSDLLVIGSYSPMLKAWENILSVLIFFHLATRVSIFGDGDLWGGAYQNYAEYGRFSFLSHVLEVPEAARN